MSGRLVTRFFRLFMALILVLLLAPARSVSADAAPMQMVGGSVMPVDNPQVVMAAERVDIWPYPDVRGFWGYTRVEATFTFRNDGPAADVLMGFPSEKAYWPEDAVFNVLVDGVETPAEFVRQEIPAGEITFASWQVFTVPFAAGQTRTVTIEYIGGNTYPGLTFRYVLHTGALWLGPIGRVEVYFHLAGLMTWDYLEPAGISPGGYSMGADDGGEFIRWVWDDLEPTIDHDIGVSLRSYGPRRYVDASSSILGKMEGPYMAFDGFGTTGWRAEPEDDAPWLLGTRPGWLESGPYAPTHGLALRGGYQYPWGDEICAAVPRDVRLRFALPGPEYASFTEEKDLLTAGAEIITWRETSATLQNHRDWQYLWLDEPVPAVAVQILVDSVYPCPDGTKAPGFTDIQFPFAPTLHGSYSAAWQLPALAADNDPTTAWITGGVGEWLETRWPDGERPVSGVRIVNGHGAGPGQYAQHGRAARLRISFDGRADRFVDLLDTADPQTFTWEPITAGSVRLTLEALYPGVEDVGTAISEVEWLTGPPDGSLALAQIIFTPTPTPTPSRTPRLASTPRPSRTPSPLPSFTPTASPAWTPVPADTATPLPSATPFPVAPTGTATPRPAVTPTPTPAAGGGLCSSSAVLLLLGLCVAVFGRRSSHEKESRE